MDIKTLNEQLPVIKINFEDIKNNLLVELKKYENLVVTEENIKTCKQRRKELTSLKNGIDSFRKDKKNELSEPIKVFENQCKELYKLVEDVEIPIKNITDTYDTRVKEKLQEHAKEMIAKYIEIENLNKYFAPRLDEIVPTIGLSFTKPKIEKEVKEKAEFLSIQQLNFNSRVEIVKQEIDKLNEDIESKLDIEKYTLSILNASDSMEVINSVRRDAELVKSIEEKAKKSCETPSIDSNWKPVDEFVSVAIEPNQEPQLEEDINQLCYANLRVTGSNIDIDRIVTFANTNRIALEILNRGEI